MRGRCVAEGAKDLLVSHPDSCIPTGPSTELETLRARHLELQVPSFLTSAVPRALGPTSVDHSLPSPDYQGAQGPGCHFGASYSESMFQ